MRRILLAVLFVVQVVAAIRVFSRMGRTGGGSPLTVKPEGLQEAQITLVVPVLNEAARISPCLESLVHVDASVGEILVVDGGSTDSTVALAQGYAQLDPRIRVIENGPAPAGTNGKVHNLIRGVADANPASPWVLTIDADVQAKPNLPATLLQRATEDGLAAISAATQQRLAGFLDGFVHPSLLSTLVYRFGIPGNSATDVMDVQANGQCMLLQRQGLASVGGFAVGRNSVCEDVTVARALVASGQRVGFAEAGDLVSVEMYHDWREAWRNWPRSLTMHDQFAGSQSAMRLLDISLTQALPVLLLPVVAAKGAKHPLLKLNAGLLVGRFGVLAGMRRAYRNPPASYWLSPLFDPAAIVQLWLHLRKRRHSWRGQPLVRGVK